MEMLSRMTNWSTKRKKGAKNWWPKHDRKGKTGRKVNVKSSNNYHVQFMSGVHPIGTGFSPKHGHCPVATIGKFPLLESECSFSACYDLGLPVIMKEKKGVRTQQF